MGRLSRTVLAVSLAWSVVAATPRAAAGFDGFGPMTADATYGVGMDFTVQLDGAAPDRLELLLSMEGSDVLQVAPVVPSGGSASYTWDAERRYLTPSTEVTYRWRATLGDQQVLSPPGHLVYDDDRAGLDWQSVTLGDATVHWYGDAEDQARHFGELTSGAVDRASGLLGHDLDGPVDIFVYDARQDFFGALGPGAREWTGAVAYPELRTIFMWLQGGPPSYLDTTLVHEVTHVVFDDATRNAFHEPAHWLNEGISTWSEQQSAEAARFTVQSEASGGLFSFDAISAQFPLGDRGARLAYAQGTALVGMIIDDYGPAAVARIAAAYRQGASDEEALQAGTLIRAEELYARFYSAFGAAEPEPIEAAPIRPSNVRHPGAPRTSGQAEPAASARGEPAPEVPGVDLGVVIAVILIGAVAAGLVVTAFVVRRRNEPRGPGAGA